MNENSSHYSRSAHYRPIVIFILLTAVRVKAKVLSRRLRVEYRDALFPRSVPVLGISYVPQFGS